MPTQAVSPADPRNYFGFAKQVAKGTDLAPVYFAAYVDEVGFDHGPNVRTTREAGGGHVIARQTMDFRSPGVQFSSPIRPDVGAAILAYFSGVSPAPSGAGPYTHTITPDVVPVWLSCEWNLSDEVIHRLEDALLSRATVSYRKRDSGSELMIAATATGLNATWPVAATAETYETDRPYRRSDCDWTVDGNPAVNVESCVLDFSWRMDEAMLADEVYRADLVKLHLECAVELVQLWNTTDEYNAYRSTHFGDPAGTQLADGVYRGSLLAEVDNAEAGAANRQLNISLAQVDWGEGELSPLNPDASEAVRLTRRGTLVSNGASPAYTITAINSKSTAYV